MRKVSRGLLVCGFLYKADEPGWRFGVEKSVKYGKLKLWRINGWPAGVPQPSPCRQPEKIWQGTG